MIVRGILFLILLPNIPLTNRFRTRPLCMELTALTPAQFV